MATGDEECKGCISYKQAIPISLTCDLPLKVEGYECPCFTCLVKGICNQHINCPKIKKYVDYIRKNELWVAKT